MQLLNMGHDFPVFVDKHKTFKKAYPTTLPLRPKEIIYILLWIGQHGNQGFCMQWEVNGN